MITCPACSDVLPDAGELCHCPNPVCWGCHDEGTHP